MNLNPERVTLFWEMIILKPAFHIMMSPLRGFAAKRPGITIIISPLRGSETYRPNFAKIIVLPVLKLTFEIASS